MPEVYSPTINPAPTEIKHPTNTGDWMKDIPGGDIPFDELFNQPVETTPQVTTPTVEEPTTPSPSQPQSTPQFEIKTSTGTVYKTVDDAIKGIEKKDTLIEELRQRYILERGVDPITNQPVRVGGQPQVPDSYAVNQTKYMKDLADAVAKGDELAYHNTQAKFVYDILSPIAPLINDFARNKAMETVSSEIQDFRTFRQSEDFKQVLEHNRALKGAIEAAESDFRGYEQLPELYRLAYLASQGAKLPELVKQQVEAAKAAAAQSQPQPVRQTLAPSTQAPIATVGVPVTQDGRPDLTTSEGRKAFMKQFADAGGLNRRL